MKTSPAFQTCANKRAANQCLGSFQFARPYSPTRSLAAQPPFRLAPSLSPEPSGQPGGFRKLCQRDSHTSFAVIPAPPSLVFTAIPSQTYGVAPLTAAATSNSTGATTYSVVKRSGHHLGHQRHYHRSETVTLQASQVATTNHTAATATTSFSVAGETPNFTFAAIPNQTYRVAPFTVPSTSNSPGAISYTGSIGPASLSGNVVTITGSV